MTSLAVDDTGQTGRSRRLSDEMLLTIALLAFSFVGVGLPRVFTATAAETLFIGTYGAKFLPYTYLAEALLIPVLGHLYMKADEKFGIRNLVLGSMIVDVIVQTMLWSGYGVAHIHQLAFFGPIWGEVEFVFCSLWLWGMATRLMTLRQGKRLFGYISAGEPVAIILAGTLTPFILEFLSPQGLFLLSGISVALGLLLVMFILKRFTLHSHAESEDEDEATESASDKKWYLNRYVQVLVAIVVISQLAYFFADNAFYLEAGARFPDEEQLGAFIGKFMAAVGVLSLIVSLFVSGPLAKRFGLRTALLLLPLLLASTAAIGSLLGLSFGAGALVFWAVVIVKTLDQSLRYTIDKTSSVTLYAPLPAGLRHQVQAVLESLIEPIVGGVSGLILALFVQFLGFGTIGIMIMIFLIAAAWFVLVFVQDRYYQGSLRSALRARRMGAGQLTVEDPSAIAVIMEALVSQNTGEVLNGIALAGRIVDFDIVGCYRGLLEHPAPEIRHDVLRRIEVLGPGSMPAQVILARVQQEFDPTLRAEALRTLATLDPDNALDNLESYLSSSDEPVRREAFVGLLRHGGIEGILRAGEPLLEALRSPDADQRRFAASVLEGTHSPGFSRALTNLMADPEASVRAAALRAVGVAQTPSMWPRAVALLNDEIGDVSRTAASILVTAGDPAVGPLIDFLDDPSARQEARRLAARVLGEIGTDKARVHLLVRLDQTDRKIAEAVLFAIPKQTANPDEATAKIFMNRLGEILQDAAHATSWRATLGASPLPDIDPVLYRALGDQIDDDIKSIFNLLTLIYPEDKLDDAYRNFRYGDPSLKSVAMEALEVALRNEYRTAVLAFIEHDTDASRQLALPPSMRSETVESIELPAFIAAQPASLVSPWTRAASLYSVIGLDRLSTLPTNGFPLLDEPLCRELIEFHAKRGDMLTIEKVLILRNTPIFSAVREEHLVDVAQRAEPIELAQDAVLFHQGDAGNSMYVVVDGRIRIYAGNHTIAELGAREVVGEMAAVDPEARSASVCALEPTLLLRISNQNIELLIDHDPDVARGIIKVLCARLRLSGAKPAAKPALTTLPS